MRVSPDRLRCQMRRGRHHARPSPLARLPWATAYPCRRPRHPPTRARSPPVRPAQRRASFLRSFPAPSASRVSWHCPPPSCRALPAAPPSSFLRRGALASPIRPPPRATPLPTPRSSAPPPLPRPPHAPPTTLSVIRPRPARVPTAPTSPCQPLPSPRRRLSLADISDPAPCPPLPHQADARHPRTLSAGFLAIRRRTLDRAAASVAKRRRPPEPDRPALPPRARRDRSPSEAAESPPRNKPHLPFALPPSCTLSRRVLTSSRGVNALSSQELSSGSHPCSTAPSNRPTRSRSRSPPFSTPARMLPPLPLSPPAAA